MGSGSRTGCYQFLRFLVFINNFIFWLFGLGVVAVRAFMDVVFLFHFSIWLLFDEQLYGQTLESQKADYFTGSYMILVIGALITIIGFLGCCGAWKESSCMLGSFFALLLVIFIGEICFCVWVYFQFKNEAIETAYFSTHMIDKSVEETVMKKYEYNISTASVHTFDKIQEELECCGVRGPQDWADSVYNKHGKNSPPPDLYKIPTSCCRVPESKACIISTQLGRSDQPDSVILYTEGCAEKMKIYAEENQFIAVAVLIIIGILEILGMCLSMFLCCTISRIRNLKA